MKNAKTRTKKTVPASDAKRMLAVLRAKRNRVLKFKRHIAADAITRQWADGKIAGINVAIRMVKSLV